MNNKPPEFSVLSLPPHETIGENHAFIPVSPTEMLQSVDQWTDPLSKRIFLHSLFGAECFSGTCLVMAERVCRAKTEKAVNVNKIRLIHLCELCLCGAKGKLSWKE